MDWVGITERFLKDKKLRNSVILVLLGIVFFFCVIYVALSIDWKKKAADPTRFPTPGTDIKTMMGKTGNAANFYVDGIRWFQLEPKSCNVISDSQPGSSNQSKIIVAEVAVRNKGKSVAEISEFVFTDKNGHVYKAVKSYDYQYQTTSCLPGLTSPYMDENKIDPEYGDHFYLVSDPIPGDVSGFQINFNLKWLYEYFDYFIPTGTPEVNITPEPSPTPELVETQTGTTRVFISMGDEPSDSSPDKSVVGYPKDVPVSLGNAIANKLKLTLGEAGSVPAEKADWGTNGIQYYVNVSFEDVDKNIMKYAFQNVKLFLVDTYGVKFLCKMETEAGVSYTLSPGEKQTYLCTFSVQESSVSAGPLIFQFENGLNFDYQKKYLQMVSFDIVKLAPTSVAGGSVTATPTVECSSAPKPHMVVGQRGYVTFSPPLPNRVRENPGLDGKYITSFKPGMVVDIIGGPQCVSDMYWWNITNKSTGVTGWTSEGGDGKYWLEVCKNKDNCY